jgi:hypothetical protein
MFVPPHKAMGEGIAIDAAGNIYTAEATLRGVGNNTAAGIAPNLAYEAHARSEIAQEAQAWHFLLWKPRLKLSALSRYFVSEKLLSGITSGKKLASHFYRCQRSFAV